MQEILTQFLLQSVAMILTSAIIPGLMISSIFGPMLMVIGLTLVNSFFWDSTLFQAIPSDVTSQTLSLFLANGVLFWVLVKILPGIEVEGILPALFAPIVFTIVGIFVEKYGRTIDWSLVLTQVQEVIGQFKSQVQGNMGQAINHSP